MDFKPFKMGKYLLLERLATGGMAEVYRAKAQGAGGFEKQVAIKRILPTYSQNDEFRKMFEYEARLSSMLTHSNIVQIFDFNKFGETYLLAMEYVDGKNLRQFVNKCKKANITPSIEFSVFVMNEVCKGLEYAHTKKDDNTGKQLNIIHRDMSPQNVMLSYEGAVKIVDFGIAKAKDRVDETRSGVIKGKFGYMSPEQANGLSVDHKTDIFSTGIILWEMLTGRRLFSADSDLATLRMIQECVVIPPSKVNPRVPIELDRIVMKVLSKDLRLRYSSAGDLHRSLLEFLSKNAPTYTQREVSDFLQKVFVDDISKEKKRYEQLNRQSIPFSQGARKKEKPPQDEMAEVEDALEGLQTKSDVAEQTGDTFADQSESFEGEVGELEQSEDGGLEVPAAEPEVSGAFIVNSKVVDSTEFKQPKSEGSISQLTKSQVSVPTEGEEAREAVLDVTRPSIEIDVLAQEAGTEGVPPSEELQEEEPQSSGSDPHSIEIKGESENLDLVLPGGAKHEFTKGAPPPPSKQILLEQEAPTPETKVTLVGTSLSQRVEPKIVPMDAIGDEPPEPRTGTSNVDMSTLGKGDTNASTNTGSGMPKTPPEDSEPAPTTSKTPILARGVSVPRSKAKPSQHIEVEAQAELERPKLWGAEEAPQKRRPQIVRRPKRLIHPVARLLIVTVVMGYGFKLYFDGEFASWIEQNGPREPTQAEPLIPKSDTDPVSVDRKPVGDCTLNVQSQPPGAEVFEGGESRGFTPLILSGPCSRSINISLRKEGYETLSENVVIGSKVAEWFKSLKQIPIGRLALTLGFNAQVFINGEAVRDAQARQLLEIPLRAKRTYTLKLVNPTLSIDVEAQVAIEDGRQTNFRLSLDEASQRSKATTKK